MLLGFFKWIYQKPVAYTIEKPVAHSVAAWEEAAASNTVVSPPGGIGLGAEALWVVTGAVTELDRTAGLGHKPPRCLSGTFLVLFLVTKENTHK